LVLNLGWKWNGVVGGDETSALAEILGDEFFGVARGASAVVSIESGCVDRVWFHFLLLAGGMQGCFANGR
jgi:hypothetical protein